MQASDASRSVAASSCAALMAASLSANAAARPRSLLRRRLSSLAIVRAALSADALSMAAALSARSFSPSTLATARSPLPLPPPPHAVLVRGEAHATWRPPQRQRPRGSAATLFSISSLGGAGLAACPSPHARGAGGISRLSNTCAPSPSRPRARALSHLLRPSRSAAASSPSFSCSSSAKRVAFLPISSSRACHRLRDQLLHHGFDIALIVDDRGGKLPSSPPPLPPASGCPPPR